MSAVAYFCEKAKPVEIAGLKAGGLNLTTSTQQNNYLVLVMNLTDSLLEYARINDEDWFEIPRICGRCNEHNCERCFENNIYSPYLYIPFNGAPFDLTVVGKPDPQGSALGATWHIDPRCGEAGAILCLNNE